MSTVTPLVDPVDDLWPPGGAPGGDLLAELVVASNLLGANRAVSNFGGGNTSAKGTAVDHAGREVDVMWVKGSGSDLATMGPRHFTGLRMAEMLPLMERRRARGALPQADHARREHLPGGHRPGGAALRLFHAIG